MFMNKRGKAQANIIVTVLIILVVLVAMIIVWNVVQPLIRTSTEQVEGDVFSISLALKNIKVGDLGGARITIKREPGKGELTELKFIFQNDVGERQIITKDLSTDSLDELQTKTYEFGINEINFNPEKISVTPVFEDNTGIEVHEIPTSFLRDENGNRVTELIEFTESKYIEDNKVYDSLVSWWKFDGDFKDSVGDNDGTGINQSNTNGNALNLDGDGDYVDCGNDESLNITNKITIGAWIYPLVSEGMIVYKHNTIYYDKPGYAFVYLGSNLLRGHICDNANNVKYTSIDVGNLKNKWSHIVFIYNGTVAKIYHNGEYKGQETFDLDIGTATRGLYIGGGSGNYDNFNGSIDNIMIFNKSLSDAEIKAIYNNQKKT